MFNKQKFNRSGFNRGSQESTVFNISCSFKDSLKCETSSGKMVELKENYSEDINSKVKMAYAIPSIIGLNDETLQKVKINVGIPSTANYCEQINSNIYVGKDISYEGDFEDLVEYKIYIGKDINCNFDFDDKIFNKTILSKYLNVVAGVSEILGANMRSRIEETQNVLLNISLKSGETLIIDSDKYLVTADGENKLFGHSGDWIILDRTSTSIEIDCNGNGISGVVSFKEAYL